MALLDEVRTYWNAHIHDLEMTSHEPGTKEFFEDLDAYRFDKLRYLPKLVDFDAYRGKRILEVGCGIGTDLVRFAKGGASVSGIDLSETAIDLARKNVELNGVKASLEVGNGEEMPYEDESFDVVYGHGVLQYTADPKRMVHECRRVLRTGGTGMFMVYNRLSWLNALSKLMRVELEHEDAPVLRKYSIAELERLLSTFSNASIVPERFPVRSRLHGGWKGFLFNHGFVQGFELLPRTWVRPFGWHLMAFCER